MEIKTLAFTDPRNFENDSIKTIGNIILWTPPLQSHMKTTVDLSLTYPKLQIGKPYGWLALHCQGFFSINWEGALAFHFGKFKRNFGQIGKK